MPFFCYNKNDYCDHSENCDNCEVWVFGKGGKEVPTNADRIRAMSDEELAYMFSDYCKGMENCHRCFCYDSCPGENADSWMKWLQQPADKGE